MSFCGPGETKIEYAPGTDTFTLEQAIAGHIMLPCVKHDSRPKPKAGGTFSGGYGKVANKKDSVAISQQGESSGSGGTVSEGAAGGIGASSSSSGQTR